MSVLLKVLLLVWTQTLLMVLESAIKKLMVSSTIVLIPFILTLRVVETMILLNSTLERCVVAVTEVQDHQKQLKL